MIKNPIRKGQKVQIEANSRGITGFRTILDCYIVEPDFDRITITFPEDKQELIPYFSEGTEIKAFIYTFAGIFIVDSIVFDAPENGQMVIEFNEQHQTIQRRKYARAGFETDMYIQDENGNKKIKTIDISGGGVRFLTDMKLTDTQKLCTQIRINTYEPTIKAEGVILKKSYFKDNEYVLEFTSISEENREKIVKKCKEIEKKQENMS